MSDASHVHASRCVADTQDESSAWLLHLLQLALHDTGRLHVSIAPTMLRQTEALVRVLVQRAKGL